MAFFVLILISVSSCAFAGSVLSEHFEVVYPGAGGLYAQLVSEIAEKGYVNTVKVLGRHSSGRITIHLTQSREEFDGLTRNALPDWSSAVSLSKDRIVLSPLAGKKMDLEHILPHEIVHCLINDAAGVAFVPCWFHEGMAEMLSGGLGIRSRWLLTAKSIRGELLSFIEIQRIFSADQSVASVAYDQSHLAVNFLAELHGAGIYAAIIKGLDNGDSFQLAFENATSVSPERFEALYLQWVRDNYNVKTLLSFLPGTWTAILLIAFLAYAATKFRNRRTIKRWDREDRPGNIIDFNSFPPDDD